MYQSTISKQMVTFHVLGQGTWIVVIGNLEHNLFLMSKTQINPWVLMTYRQVSHFLLLRFFNYIILYKIYRFVELHGASKTKWINMVQYCNMPHIRSCLNISYLDIIIASKKKSLLPGSTNQSDNGSWIPRPN